MPEFRKDIPRSEFHSLIEELIGAPIKDAHIVEIRCHIHTIEVFTIARDSAGKPFGESNGEVARHCHVIGVGASN